MTKTISELGSGISENKKGDKLEIMREIWKVDNLMQLSHIFKCVLRYYRWDSIKKSRTLVYFILLYLRKPLVWLAFYNFSSCNMSFKL